MADIDPFLEVPTGPSPRLLRRAVTMLLAAVGFAVLAVGMLVVAAGQVAPWVQPDRPDRTIAMLAVVPVLLAGAWMCASSGVRVLRDYRPR